MDIIRYTYPNEMMFAEVVNGLASKMWVERYREAGEFTLVARAYPGIRDKLPIGSFISHLDTRELMIVENHEISDDKSKDTEIIITGRGFETAMEQRIVGSNKTFPTSGPISDYSLNADTTWNQAVKLISDHILASALIDDNDAIPYVDVATDIVGTGVNEVRTVKRGSLYARLLEILAVENLGIRALRPDVSGPPAATLNSLYLIHKGVDLSSSVIFSGDTGEIESADYLWSNKLLKNTAMVSGTWVETLVTTPETWFNRRMMFVDASDIDKSYSAAPTGATLDAVVAAMQQRGQEALAAQNDVALTKIDVSKNAAKSTYRQDFNVGDIISVHGEYNTSTTMRISEYVEIEDENGRQGYPTLTAV